MGMSRHMWVPWSRSSRSAPPPSSTTAAGSGGARRTSSRALGAGPVVLVGTAGAGRSCAAQPVTSTTAARRARARRPERRALRSVLRPRQRPPDQVAKVVVPALARLGLLRLMTRGLAASLPEPASARMQAEDTTPAAGRAQLAELEHSVADLRALRSRHRRSSTSPSRWSPAPDRGGSRGSVAPRWSPPTGRRQPPSPGSPRRRHRLGARRPVHRAAARGRRDPARRRPRPRLTGLTAGAGGRPASAARSRPGQPGTAAASAAPVAVGAATGGRGSR